MRHKFSMYFLKELKYFSIIIPNKSPWSDPVILIDNNTTRSRKILKRDTYDFS